MSTAGPEDIDQLAGEFVLGTLPFARRVEVEQRMAAEAPLRVAVNRWQAQLLPLTTLADRKSVV